MARPGERADRSSAPEAVPPSTDRRGGVWPILGAAGLYGLLHPYRGIDGDARLYVGRALADLDPAGIGRDLMFVHDGQSRFSLFPLLLRGLVEAFGPAQAALAVSLAGLVAWFCAAAALAAGLAGRGRWLVLAAMAALPASYGFPGVFRVGEALATPRTLAEAAVLASLGACAAGRDRLAGLLALLGCLVHPIMGLAGVAVLALVLAARDRRWLIALVALPLAALAAAALGLPLFDRLLQGLDPEFSAILRLRCADLFPSFWPGAAWGPIVVQGASILIGATLAPSRVRPILYAALGAGLTGVAVSAFFGDRWPVLLMVQLQPWRFLWLTAVVGAAAFGLCAAGLWGRRADRLTLGLLALGWLFADDLVIAAGAGAMALALHTALRRTRIDPTPRVILVTGTLIGVLAASRLVFELSALTWLLGHRDEGAELRLGMIRNFSLVPTLAVGGGLVWTRAAGHRGARIVLGAGLALALVALWDERTVTARAIEARTALPGLAATVAHRPGAVLWLDGEAQAWLLLSRANWSSNLQGAGIVFSPVLARTWAERMDRLIAAGLAAPNDRAPFHPAGPRRPDDPPAAAVAILCAAPDAPAWIVVPLRDRQDLPGNAGIFPLAAPVVTARTRPEGVSWHRTVAYGLLPCRG